MAKGDLTLDKLSSGGYFWILIHIRTKSTSCFTYQLHVYQFVHHLQLILYIIT